MKSRMKETGDGLTNQQKKLIEDNVDIVDIIIQKRFKAYVKQGYKDDMLFFGYEGLMQASLRYDFSKKIKFKTFASYRIWGSIMDGMEKLFDNSISLYSPVETKDSEDLSLINTISDNPVFEPEYYIVEKEKKELLKRALKVLSPRRYKMVYLAYFRMMAYKEVAKIMQTNKDCVACHAMIARKLLKKELNRIGFNYN